MKKSFTLISSLLFAFGSFAQSQRTVLSEEFTQASCGPCAAQNPAYNALLRNNQDKVISLKYQTSWPGSDPMNAQNPTEVQSRVDYYGVTGVPDTYVDGNVQSSVAPGNITQTIIDNEYSALAPYDIILNHSLNAAQDSIFITMTINCTQAVTGPLVARVAIVENFIKFSSAPGSNGEKDFQYNIMRKMLPNAAGTTLATSWTPGQTQTLTFAAKIPTYIYDKKQLGVVAFIQNNTTKNVKQAAYSAMLDNDASIALVTDANPAPGCSVSFNPIVKIINKGKTPLISAIVTPTVDGVAGTPINWSGSLSIFQSDVVTMPTVTSTTGGSHTYAVSVTLPNGAVDVATQEDSYNSKFYLFSNAVAYPYSQDFTTTGFPYTNWIVENFDNDATWTRVTAGSTGNTGSAKIDFYNGAPGNVDNMYIPSIDLSNTITASNVLLSFKVAGAPYSSENDQLKVEASSDCGATWTEVWNKAGSDLYTSAATTSAYTPTAAQFRDEVINLNAFKGQSKVIIRYSAVSDYGNNVYVDKINLAEITAAPVAAFTGCNTSVIANGTVTFTDASTNFPTSWNWTITPATGWHFLAGSTAGSQNPKVVFDSTGVYDVAMTATSSLGSNSHANPACLNVLNTSSVKEVAAVHSVRIFPNPANSSANIRLVLDKTEQVGIDVYNVIGEKVYTVNNNTIAAGEHFFKINTQDLSNGVYMISIVTSEGTTTQKFVVSK